MLKKVLLGLSVLLAAGAAYLALRPAARQAVGLGPGPEPVAAWVAVEVADSGVGLVGPVDVDAGTEVTLHAVLEAVGRDGERIFYSRAPALRVGGRDVPSEAIRAWDRPLTAKVLWFTVENPSPSIHVPQGAETVDLRYQEQFRPDWPQAWSIPADLQPRYRTAATVDGPEPVPEFGTQRYHVRIELFGTESEIRPRRRVSSPAAQALEDAPEDLAAITASLPGALALPSEVFGLPVLSGPGLPALASDVDDLWRRRLAVSRSRLLAAMVEHAGVSLRSAPTREVDLAAAEVPWGGDGASPGDLLQVGGRIVVLARDEGVPDRLDDGDVVLDYEGGAAVRRLSDVFSGDGLVEWVRLQGGSE